MPYLFVYSCHVKETSIYECLLGCRSLVTMASFCVYATFFWINFRDTQTAYSIHILYPHLCHAFAVLTSSLHVILFSGERRCVFHSIHMIAHYFLLFLSLSQTHILTLALRERERISILNDYTHHAHHVAGIRTALIHQIRLSLGKYNVVSTRVSFFFLSTSRFRLFKFVIFTQYTRTHTHICTVYKEYIDTFALR